MKILTGRRDEDWKAYVVRGFVFILIVLFVVGIYGALEPVNEVASQERAIVGNQAVTARKLLTPATDGKDKDDGGSNNTDDGYASKKRIGMGSFTCSKDDILVFQEAASPLPSGIPTYSVEIQNACPVARCNISNIHLSCGWFSSARLVNPRVFRRIGYDDCLVKDGEPLNPGEALSFQYANTFKYPLSVSSISC